jgi:hypothetical protein
MHYTWKFFRQAFDVEDNIVMSRFRSVIGRILASEVPLSVFTHSQLRGSDNPRDDLELILPSWGHY